MKYFFSLFIILLSIRTTYAQVTVPGYYVTNTNDTVRTQIKLPKNIMGTVLLSKLLDEVDLVDSSQASKTFTPADIAGYGFSFNGSSYRLYSKPIKNGSRKFLQAKLTGPKTSLYLYSRTTSGGAGSSNVQMLYTFEKADGTCTFLQNSSTLNAFREKLKSFYSDYPKVMEVIDTKFQQRISIDNDIKEILQLVNHS